MISLWLENLDDYQVLQGLHRFPLEGRQVIYIFSYSQPYVNVVKEKIEPRQSSQSILQLGFTNFHVNMEIKITLL